MRLNGASPSQPWALHLAALLFLGMTQLPIAKECPAAHNCTWMLYVKHLPHRGMKQAQTHSKASRYRSGMTREQIRDLETQTVLSGTRKSLSPFNSEYYRDLDEVIGWDEGRDATWSFVECSGGDAGGRSFHGRPMAPSNHKLEGIQ